MRRADSAMLLVLSVLAGACGNASSGGPDPVAKAEEPARVLTNSQYPELSADGLKRSYLLDTGDHLTHVLSFVDGLSMDEKAAAAALRHFEQLRREVQLDVQGDEASTLLYNVRPRNYPQRYVVIVPDGAPLPRWAGRPEGGGSFASTRPVNVDHAVTLIRLADKPFVLDAPFDTMPRAVQLDSVFMNGACARSSSITTNESAAYKYGANIHNQGEGVICAAESRLMAGRQLGIAPSAMADIATAANRGPPAPARGPSLAAPPFGERRYGQLPKVGPIFILA